MELREVKNYLENLNQEDIIIDPHFYKRCKERPVSEGLIRSFLFKLDKLERIEIGKGENRFKLWFRMSSKYSLVMIVEIIISKNLKVISAWNSNRKWQKQLRQ
jgi:hypothetical protein